eukprot:5672085-Pyramimonas_sp.AAC.1
MERDDEADAEHDSFTPTMGGISCYDLPVDPSVFAAATGRPREATFKSWGQCSREAFQQQCFQKDEGRIPAGARVKIERACFQKHFGVCEFDDSGKHDVIMTSGIALW